ncbi:hypothetical protein GCM10009679_75000 [Saccharothrix algeriensis]|uniref:Uncharacterized protein n=2 Tax=Catellatospora bangladeshensis TaxID=310355 RepID=A0A8J3JQI1_9ACTN|nr:hypothetical protein Cba03nite_61820 [Catellatospora bangladeshensis]
MISGAYRGGAALIPIAALAAILTAACTGPADPTPAAAAATSASSPSAPAPTPSAAPSPDPERRVGKPTKACARREPAPGESLTPDGFLVTPMDQKMLDAIGDISHAGDRQFKSSFTGAKLVPEQAFAVVYRKPSKAFDAYIEKVSRGKCIYIRDARFTKAELWGHAMRIEKERPYWRERGIEVNHFTVETDGSVVEVGVLPEDLAQALVELPQRYGTAIPLRIVPQEPIRLGGALGPAETPGPSPS